LHVRRGDYCTLAEHHPTQSIDYYKAAVEIIGKEATYFIFSDDIPWCIEQLDWIPNKQFVQGNEPHEDLYLMSFCKSNIIANSSFSWWGAYLNQYKSKQVIVPKRWFGSAKEHWDTKDLYCADWTII
jgi:hypothetical protein